METIKKETLLAILKHFPSFECLTDGVNELVEPSYGVISGFQDLLLDIDELKKIDLHEINPFFK